MRQIEKVTGDEFLNYCYELQKTTEASFSVCLEALQELLKRTDDLETEITNGRIPKCLGSVRQAYFRTVYACFRRMRESNDDALDREAIITTYVRRAAKKGYRLYGRNNPLEFRKFNCRILLDIRRIKQLKKPIMDHLNTGALDFYFNGGGT